MRIVLVRHGETPWNEAGRYQGWEDVLLSPRGRLTARRIGRALRRRGVTPHTLWASDLARAVSTARIAFGRPPRTDARLRELDFGAYAGRTFGENVERHGRSFASWIESGGRRAPPGGETLDDLLARTTDWLAEVVRTGPPEATVVAVTHGGVMRSLTRSLVDEELWPEPGEMIVLRRNTGPTGFDIEERARDEEDR